MNRAQGSATVHATLEQADLLSKLSSYRLGAQIYASHRSLVYRGYRASDEYPVILKVLREESPSPTQLAWFRREYEITRSLQLEGIPKVLALVEDRQKLAIVLEDVGSESLARLGLAGKLSIAKFLKLAIALTGVIARVHRAHVVHKDINPSNITLNPTSQQLQLIDFGISTVLSRERLTFCHPKGLEGTLPYLAPEQTGRTNRVIDYRTDFYALGVTFYELLIGHPPFQYKSADVLEWIHSHIAKQPLPPSQLNPSIPEAVSEIVLKLMAKNAEDRYQSAEGLYADLEHCLKQWDTDGRIISFCLAQQDTYSQFSPSQRLYGRDIECRKLIASFERTCQGGSELLMVSGYSGVGKSALVREVYQAITAKKGTFIAGKYDPLRFNVPFCGVVQAFNDFCKQILCEGEVQLANWRDTIALAVGDRLTLLTALILDLTWVMQESAHEKLEDFGFQDTQVRFNRAFTELMRALCQPEHPVVMFLDDLQWADRASLGLIEALCAEPIPYFLLIGAYRSNEVEPCHPLMGTLAAIAAGQKSAIEISLEPLQPGEVNALVADTFHCTLRTSQSLADLIYAKTQGNAFFIGEFLRSLHEDGAIRFQSGHHQSETAGWIWDVTQIQAKTVADNVADLLAKRLEQFPPATQHALQWAACIGHTFDLDTLACATQQSPPQVLKSLWAALQVGTIIPLSNDFQLFVDWRSLFTRPESELTEQDFAASNAQQPEPLPLTYVKVPTGVRFRFQHDRVQQAAYRLVPELERETYHLQIGWLLLNRTPIASWESRIFEIVNHLNCGISLICDPEERVEIAQLNEIAARKALAAGAYIAVDQYCRVGLALLPPSSWHSHYDLTLHLHELAAEVAYRQGNFTEEAHWSGIVFSQAAARLDCTRAYEIRLQSLVAQNQMTEALQVAQQFLRQLGAEFPENPQPSDFQAALAKTTVQLAGQSISDLAGLPDMRDPVALAIIRILNSIHTPIYRVAPALFPLSIFQQVLLSLQHGNSPLSATAYAYYGLILCGILNDIGLGYQFGNLALSLLDRLPGNSARSATLLTVGAAVSHWKEPLSKSLLLLKLGFTAGRESGDFQSAGFSYFLYAAHAYFSGRGLQSLTREFERCVHSIAQLNQQTALKDCSMYAQVLCNWREDRLQPEQIVGPLYDEAAMIPLLEETANLSSAGHLWINKLILAYVFGDLERADQYRQKSLQYIPGLLGTIMVPIFHFYAALTLLGRYDQLNTSQQAIARTEVSEHHAKLQDWATHSPANYAHKARLVCAEMARVSGEYWQAAQAYEQAIQGANRHGFTQEEALGWELAANFYQGQEMIELSNSCLQRAYRSYQYWQAIAKTKELERRYPHLFLQGNRSALAERDTLSMSTRRSETLLTQNLNLSSILKASQVLAGEIELKHLLTRLMEIVMENAGADRGCLLLARGTNWHIAASGNLTQGIEAMKDLPLESLSEPLHCPISLVRYVIRTQESVVWQDAASRGAFSRDPYLHRYSPQSVVCFPLIYQGKLDGVVYLENSLTPGAFTDDRIEVLNLLSSQAAISIENAKLYDQLKQYSQTLEQKVAERTQELQCLNRELHLLATVDTLTQVANRRQFDDYLQQEWSRAIREQQPLSLVLCDVDFFKRYNDTYGHQAGDRCLQRIAKALQGAIHRPADLVARYGGEEFAIILPNTRMGDAAKVVERVKAHVDELNIPHGSSSISDHVSLSLGLTCAVPSLALSPEQLIVSADRALYKAKEAGRNTYRSGFLI
ncbi:MAG TPA: diguanylate cyclase [Stenomitos sp.]